MLDLIPYSADIQKAKEWNLAPLEGTYYRTEEDEPTKRFRNGMKLTIESCHDGVKGTLEYMAKRGPKGKRRKQSLKYEVPLKFDNEYSFVVDWRPVDENWGLKTFHTVPGSTGTTGLLEENKFFWEREAPRLEDAAVASAHSSPSEDVILEFRESDRSADEWSEVNAIRKELGWTPKALDAWGRRRKEELEHKEESPTGSHA